MWYWALVPSREDHPLAVTSPEKLDHAECYSREWTGDQHVFWGYSLVKGLVRSHQASDHPLETCKASKS